MGTAEITALPVACGLRGCGLGHADGVSETETSHEPGSRIRKRLSADASGAAGCTDRGPRAGAPLGGQTAGPRRWQKTALHSATLDGSTSSPLLWVWAVRTKRSTARWLAGPGPLTRGPLLSGPDVSVRVGRQRWERGEFPVAGARIVHADAILSSAGHVLAGRVTWDLVATRGLGKRRNGRVFSSSLPNGQWRLDDCRMMIICPRDAVWPCLDFW